MLTSSPSLCVQNPVTPFMESWRDAVLQEFKQGTLSGWCLWWQGIQQGANVEAHAALREALTPKQRHSLIDGTIALLERSVLPLAPPLPEELFSALRWWFRHEENPWQHPALLRTVLQRAPDLFLEWVKESDRRPEDWYSLELPLSGTIKVPALHVAVFDDKPEVVQALLEAGCPPDLLDSRKFPAWCWLPHDVDKSTVSSLERWREVLGPMPSSALMHSAHSIRRHKSVPLPAHTLWLEYCTSTVALDIPALPQDITSLTAACLNFTSTLYTPPTKQAFERLNISGNLHNLLACQLPYSTLFPPSFFSSTPSPPSWNTEKISRWWKDLPDKDLTVDLKMPLGTWSLAGAVAWWMLSACVLLDRRESDESSSRPGIGYRSSARAYPEFGVGPAALEKMVTRPLLRDLLVCLEKEPDWHASLARTCLDEKISGPNLIATLRYALNRGGEEDWPVYEKTLRVLVPKLKPYQQKVFKDHVQHVWKMRIAFSINQAYPALPAPALPELFDTEKSYVSPSSPWRLPEPLVALCTWLAEKKNEWGFEPHEFYYAMPSLATAVCSLPPKHTDLHDPQEADLLLRAFGVTLRHFQEDWPPYLEEDGVYAARLALAACHHMWPLITEYNSLMRHVGKEAKTYQDARNTDLKSVLHTLAAEFPAHAAWCRSLATEWSPTWYRHTQYVLLDKTLAPLVPQEEARPSPRRRV